MNPHFVSAANSTPSPASARLCLHVPRLGRAAGELPAAAPPSQRIGFYGLCGMRHAPRACASWRQRAWRQQGGLGPGLREGSTVHRIWLDLRTGTCGDFGGTDECLPHTTRVQIIEMDAMADSLFYELINSRPMSLPPILANLHSGNEHRARAESPQDSMCRSRCHDPSVTSP